MIHDNSINKLTVKYNNKNSLKKNITKVKSILKKNGLCIVKNFNQNSYKKIYYFINKKLLTSKEVRISGPFNYKRDDYVRLDIGDRAKNARFARFMTFFEWNNNKDFFKVINPFINFRNKICGYEKKGFEYFPSKKKYKWCDLVRAIQYPIGGGFLQKHHDADLENLNTQVNLLIPITSKIKNKKNRFNNFYNGGLYYIINKKKVNIENYVNSGDLIFHNLNIDHGVEAVDDNKDLDLKNLVGRISLNFSVGKFFIV